VQESKAKSSLTKPRYIIDEPAKEDKFQAHSAIVDGIIQSILGEPRLRMIALLGRWGTGKSTIMHQFESRLALEQPDKYILFKYDAWAHQGDPARRSILEELILFLFGKSSSKLKVWKSTLQEISGEKEDSTTKKESKLTWLAKILIGLLIPLPFLVSLLDFDVLNSVFSDSPNGIGRAIVIVSMAYFVVLVGIFPVSFFSTRNWRTLRSDEKRWERVKIFWKSGPDILSLILTRNTENSSSTTVKKQQPTTIEFRRILRRIIRSQEDRRLVFVIDNLDRIDPLEALGIWSVMVGLVADEAHRVTPEKEPLVVVPLDKHALETLVKAQHNTAFDGDQLIEKSFDIIFEVPPPVLSDWRDFFEQQFRYVRLAAREHLESELYWTGRYFELWCASRDAGRITPRRINRFLNQIVSLQAQSIDRFRPSLIGYYIANRAKADADILSFLTNERPGSEVGTEWQTQVAAMHFGVCVGDAAQVLLGEELIDALTKRDPEAFESLERVAGFDDVVKNFIESPPRNEAGAVDPSPLNALAAFCGESKSRTGDPILWSRLWEVWKASPSAGADKLAASAIAAFVQSMPEEARSSASLLVERIIYQMAASRDPDGIKELVSVGDRMAQLVGDSFQASVGTDGSLLLRILQNSKKGSRFAAGLSCECDFDDLAKLTLGFLGSSVPILAADDFRLVEHSVHVGQVAGEKEAFFQIVGDGLRETLSNVESPDQALIAAATILAARNGDELRYASIITELEGDGPLGQAIDRAMENSADSVVSNLTALRLTAGLMPSGDALQRLSTWLTKDENASQLIGSINQMNDGSFLPVLHNLELNGSDIDLILKPVLGRAARRNDIGRSVPTDWLIGTFRKVASWLSATEATTYAKLITGLSGFSDGSERLSDSDFLILVSKLPSSDEKTLLGERIAGFDSIRLAKLIFAGDDVWLAYNRHRPEIGRDFTPKSEVFKALQSVFSGSLGELGSRSIQRALKFAGLLTADAQKQLHRAVVASAIESGNAEVIVALASVEGFSSYISRPSVATNAIAALFTKLRRTRDGQTFVERHATAVAHASESRRAEIKSGLERASESKDSRTADWARFVLKKSGLDR